MHTYVLLSFYLFIYFIFFFIFAISDLTPARKTAINNYNLSWSCLSIQKVPFSQSVVYIVQCESTKMKIKTIARQLSSELSLVAVNMGLWLEILYHADNPASRCWNVICDQETGDESTKTQIYSTISLFWCSFSFYFFHWTFSFLIPPEAVATDNIKRTSGNEKRHYEMTVNRT